MILFRSRLSCRAKSSKKANLSLKRLFSVDSFVFSQQDKFVSCIAWLCRERWQKWHLVIIIRLWDNPRYVIDAISVDISRRHHKCLANWHLNFRPGLKRFRYVGFCREWRYRISQQKFWGRSFWLRRQPRPPVRSCFWAAVKRRRFGPLNSDIVLRVGRGRLPQPQKWASSAISVRPSLIPELSLNPSEIFTMV